MNATTILCILLLSLYLVLAVFWLFRSIVDTIDDRKAKSVRSVMLLLRLSVKLATPNGRPSVSSLNENVPFVKSSTTKPE